jgi:hypothetical protein
MFYVTILGSGSAGNCALIESATARVLLDGGLSAKQMRERLALCGVNPVGIDAILLTHEHSDHAGGVEVWCKQFSTPVYANSLTAEALRRSAAGRRNWFTSYVDTVTQRDVPEISRIRHAHELRRLLRLLAANTGGELNIANALGSAVTVSSLTTGTGAIGFAQSGGGAVSFANATTTDGAITLSNDGANLTVGTAVSAGGECVGVWVRVLWPVRVRVTAVARPVTRAPAGSGRAPGSCRSARSWPGSRRSARSCRRPWRSGAPSASRCWRGSGARTGWPPRPWARQPLQGLPADQSNESVQRISSTNQHSESGQLIKTTDQYN